MKVLKSLVKCLIFMKKKKNGRSNYETYFKQVSTEKAKGFVGGMQT